MARQVLVSAAVVLAAIATGCTSEDDVSTATSSSTVPSVQSTVTTAPTTTTSTRPPTTTTLTTTTVRATTTTTRTVPPIDLDGLVLRGDGLGIVLLGDPMEDAIATLTDLLGPQSGDRLTEAPFGEEGEMGGGQMACWTATGTTCIDYLRVVSWDALGLCVVFSDWTEPAPGAED
jgi:hypothetical protein